MGKETRNRLSAITTYYVYQQCFKKAGIIYNHKFDEDVWAGTLLKKLGIPFSKTGADALDDKKTQEEIQYETYIRDRYRDVCKFINEDNPFETKGYSNQKFGPLLKYAGIEDYEQINDSFKNRNLLPKFCVEDILGSWVHPEKITLFLSAPEITDTVSEEQSETETSQPTGVTAMPEVIEPNVIAAVYCAKRFKGIGLLPRIPDDEGCLYFYDTGVCEFKGEKNFCIKKEELKFAEPCRMPPDKKDLWVRLEYVANQKLTEAYFAEQAPNSSSNTLALAPPARLHDAFNRVLNF